MVSLDRKEEHFLEYFKSYPNFTAVAYGSDARQAIQRMLNITMLPALVILNPDTGSVVTTYGRAAVRMNPNHCVQEWERGRTGLLTSRQWSLVYLTIMITAALLLFQLSRYTL